MINTYVVYVSILLGAFITSECVLITKTKFGEIISRSFLFVILFLPSAIRYGIGADYTEYQRLFRYDLFSEYAEPGFNLIINIIKRLSGTDWWMFFIIAFMTYYIVAKYVSKRHIALFCLYYILYGAYLRSYDQIRSSLAFVVLAIALYCFLNKEKKKAYIIIAMASMFHFSALSFFVLFPLSNIKIKRSVKICFILLTILLIMRVDFSVLMINILKPIFPRYALLASGGRSLVGSGIGIVLKCVFPMFVVLNYDNKNNRENIESNFCLFYIILSIATLQMDILNRLRDMVSVGVLVSFTDVRFGRIIRYKKCINYIIILLGIVLFLHDIDAGQGVGSNGIAPYSTIFNK